jgi:hypothetical protein
MITQVEDEPSLIVKLQVEENFTKLKDLLSVTETEDQRDIESFVSSLQMEMSKITDQNVSEARNLHSTF